MADAERDGKGYGGGTLMPRFAIPAVRSQAGIGP
jgi:hypothetical protein